MELRLFISIHKEAKCLYNSFYGAFEYCQDLIDTLSAMADDMDMNNQPDAQYAQRALDYVTTAAVIVGLTAYIYSSYIEDAMNPGKGIVWLIQQDFTTGTIGWAFEAQDWDAIEA